MPRSRAAAFGSFRTASGASMTFSNGRQVRKQLEVLEDHAEDAADLPGAGAGMVAAVGLQRVRPDADLPSSKRVQAVDAPQQRRFARAAGADQGHGLPGLDPQADVVQHRRGAEALGDVRRFPLADRPSSSFPPAAFQIARQLGQRHRHDQVQQRSSSGRFRRTAGGRWPWSGIASSVR